MAYRASALRGLAVAQMVFGALMIIFGVASIFAVDHWSSYVGYGIWVGIWVAMRTMGHHVAWCSYNKYKILITGILGFIGAKDNFTPNKCLLGCFMGFSVTACVITGIMFISYCFAVGEFASILRCRGTYGYGYGYYRTYCYSSSRRYMARNGAGLGSCLLIFSLVEFFVALASSIYCCSGICCNTTAGAVGTSVTNQQVVYLQPQQTYPGAQGGMIIIQPSGAMTSMPQGHPVASQQQGYLPHQPVALQQPAYWAVPSGSNPAGAVSVSYAGAAGTQVQTLGQVQFPEKPPPYSYPQTGDAPPTAASSGDTPSEAVPVDV